MNKEEKITTLAFILSILPLLFYFAIFMMVRNGSILFYLLFLDVFSLGTFLPDIYAYLVLQIFIPLVIMGSGILIYRSYSKKKGRFFAVLGLLYLLTTVFSFIQVS